MKNGDFSPGALKSCQYPAKPGKMRTRWKVMGISFMEKTVPSLN